MGFRTRITEEPNPPLDSRSTAAGCYSKVTQIEKMALGCRPPPRTLHPAAKDLRMYGKETRSLTGRILQVVTIIHRMVQSDILDSYFAI